MHRSTARAAGIGATMHDNPHRDLEDHLGHFFDRQDLLAEALRHSSFVNEQDDHDLRDNERLEFLGDAVLNLIVGLMLMERYPHSPEGELSQMRANLVNERRLAGIAEAIGVGGGLLLGKGEAQDSGYRKQSILADAFEALIAAVFLDGGFDAAMKLVRHHFAEAVEEISRTEANRDHKSRLQELVQSTRHTVPRYRVLDTTGPDHAKIFRVELTLNDLVTQGTGKSKKAAEQAAAKQALVLLAPDENG